MHVISLHIASIRFVGKLVIIWTLFKTKLIEFYLNNMVNLRPLTPPIIP